MSEVAYMTGSLAAVLDPGGGLEAMQAHGQRAAVLAPYEHRGRRQVPVEDTVAMAVRHGLHDGLEDLQPLVEREVRLLAQEDVQRERAVEALEDHGGPERTVLDVGAIAQHARMLTELRERPGFTSGRPLELLPASGRGRRRNQVGADAGQVVLDELVPRDMLLVALTLIDQPIEEEAPDDACHPARTQAEARRHLQEDLHQRAVDDPPGHAVIEAVHQTAGHVVLQQEPRRTPAVEVHGRDVGREHRGMDEGTILDVAIQQGGEHPRLVGHARVGALDRLPPPRLGEGPVDGVSREHTRLTLDLHKKEADSREEEQIDLVEPAARRVLQLVQLPRLVGIDVRDAGIDQIEGLPLPGVRGRAATMNASLGKSHGQATPAARRAKSAHSTSASGETTATSSWANPALRRVARRSSAGRVRRVRAAEPVKRAKSPAS